ncbi:hypothetical protein AMATHDRAFT_47442 [Amanita thiersii Skay4041]|uniref:alanine--glyoxylate transaminase n=1 Tax=Amanita thiersii Skay4041 TaxID=703135 RepID=A0A2A9NTP9_9AGAR|nr:hypothetical protein AMATHDRAFT_47442 [Amanita thiersii Skay4041]
MAFLVRHNTSYLRPIEISDEVLFANAQPPVPHTSPGFIAIFREYAVICSSSLTSKHSELLFTKDAQPFLISGSGTLGWDQVAANLVEPGESVLLLDCGYFGDSFAQCLRTYGGNVTKLKAPLGYAILPSQLENALKEKKYKIVAFTHIDSSTGVLSDAQALAAVVHRLAPETLVYSLLHFQPILVVMDGVCSVASEEIKMDEWGLDVVLTGSQKGIGIPPGLSILVASRRTMEVFRMRRAPVGSYYVSWNKWLPIMEAYESNRPDYFATPPINLIYAYNTSLKQILYSPTLSLTERFQRHKQASKAIREAVESLGLKMVAQREEERANGLTTVYFPDGMNASDLLPGMEARGVLIAGGLHEEIKDKYFRIGFVIVSLIPTVSTDFGKKSRHMGVSVVDERRKDIQLIIGFLKEVFAEFKAQKAT